MSIKDYIEEKKRETERQKKIERAKEVKKVAVNSVVAAAAGAAAGLLLAPKSGKETRDEITEYAKNTTDNIKNQVNETIDQAVDKGKQVTKDVQDAYQQYADRDMTELIRGDKKEGQNEKDEDERVIRVVEHRVKDVPVDDVSVEDTILGDEED